MKLVIRASKLSSEWVPTDHFLEADRRTVILNETEKEVGEPEQIFHKEKDEDSA